MKHFLILLFGCLPFFASAQVTISDKTADYFLEVDDKAHICDTQIKVKDLIISDLKRQILTQKLIIKTYNDPIKGDSALFRQKLATKDEELSFKDVEIKSQKKEIRKQKLLKWVVIIGLGAIIVEEEIRWLKK